MKNFLGREKNAKLNVREHVKETLAQYKETINYLEKYDKGEVPTPESVAKHRNLRSYLQSL